MVKSRYLGSWEEPAIGQTARRAWKGFCFEILDALEARGLVAQTRRAKSLHLTEQGLQRAQELEKRLASLSEERDRPLIAAEARLSARESQHWDSTKGLDKDSDRA